MTDFKNLQIELPKRVATNFGQERRSLRERKANYKSSTERLVRAIEKDGGRYVSFSDTEFGLLVCGVEYQKKLNFVYIDKDRQICCKHHGESYRLMKNIPPQLSVLNYIYTRQRAELKEYLDNFFEDNEEMRLVTPVAIRPLKPKDENDRKKKDNRKKAKSEDGSSQKSRRKKDRQNKSDTADNA